MKVLLVDDDHDLTELLQFVMDRAGFTTIIAHDVPSAIDCLVNDSPELAVIDVQLGAVDGFHLLEELRKMSAIPVIMLSGRTSEADKVRGLQMGADDYLTKPFSHRELVAHIQAKLRRSGRSTAPPPSAPLVVTSGAVTLRVADHSVTKLGLPIELSTTEFRLLQCLMARAGAVLSRSEILRTVWGYDTTAEADVVRVTVYRLRRKLGAGPNGGEIVRTVPGVGFLFDPDA